MMARQAWVSRRAPHRSAWYSTLHALSTLPTPGGPLEALLTEAGSLCPLLTLSPDDRVAMLVAAAGATPASASEAAAVCCTLCDTLLQGQEQPPYWCPL